MSDLKSEERVKTAVAEPKLPGLAGTVAQADAEPMSLRGFFRRDLGVLPVVITLVLIAVYFQIVTGGDFLSPRNLSDLVQQIVTPGILAIAAVLVLLIGEIDLSLAAVAGVGSAVTATLSVYQDWNAWPAILAGVLTGAIIGLVNGFFISYLRVPSFIVTLAGSIGFAGMLLLIMGRQSTLIVRDPTIRALAPTYLDGIVGVGLPILAALIYIVTVLLEQRRRAQAGLKTKGVSELALRLGGTLVVTAIVVFFLQSNLGVPQGALIWIGLVVIVWLLLTKTAYGRHIYAAGGSSEGARRAGINVVWVKISIFVLASTLAAFGGIMLASRSTAVATQIDSTLLLRAIAAAVIGGVSLFGGRGSVWAVVMGSLVIGSLENGLNLLNQEQSVKNVVQGVVLVLAVTADALVRRANSKTSR